MDTGMITGQMITTPIRADSASRATIDMAGLRMEQTYAIIIASSRSLSLYGSSDSCSEAVVRMVNRLSRTLPFRLPGPTLDKETGNDNALGSFLAEQGKKAFYIAHAALWDRETAMDVVQESMLRLVEYYRRKPENEWSALFYTILASRINDVRRKRLIEQGRHKLVSLTGLFRNHQEQDSADTEYELPAIERTDGITAPETEYLAVELRNHINRALQTLSERQRQVFILREWRGMSITETAEILGCSENSIKQHHFRALRALREQLAEVWGHVQTSTS